MENELKKINKNSTLIVTSTTDDYKLEQVNDNTYKLYIPDYIISIDYLFAGIKQIKKFIFDNWDTSGLISLNNAFANLELNEFPDFSKQNFSEVSKMENLFCNTKVNNDCVFSNHTLNNLKTISGMFSNFTCNNLTLDLNRTKLSKAMNVFRLAKVNNIKFTLKETNDRVSFSFCFYKCNVENSIDLSRLNTPKLMKTDCIFTNTNCSKLIMPDSIQNDKKEIIVSKNIKEIYCTKKISKTLIIR